jgi:hypothetical protein
MLREGALRGDCSIDSVACSAERNEERVALRVDFLAGSRREGRAEHSSVFGE